MSSDSSEKERFPYPDEVEVPEGCEGWEEMFPDYYIFGRTDDRVEYERERLWYWNQKDTPRPIRPWDASVCVETPSIPLSQAFSRVYAVPDAMGMDLRVIAGYSYFSSLSIEDPELIEERAGMFEERIGYVYQNFDELYQDHWLPAVKRIGNEIRDLEVPDELPKYAPESVIFESEGLYDLPIEIQRNYNRLQELTVEGWYRHFEYLNLVYLAYLTFEETCRELFPDISDDAIAKMVSGFDTDLYRTDDKLSDLADLAMELDDEVVSILKSDVDPDEKLAQLEEAEDGDQFLEAFNETKDPWFYITNSRGYHSVEGSWLDTLEQPFNHLQEKIERLEQGESIRRDVEELQQRRDEVVNEYRSYLDSEEELERFNRSFGTIMAIYGHSEDHQFWIENWLDTIIFDKLKEFGQLLVNHDMLDDPDDIALFDRFKVAEILKELTEVWSKGPKMRTPVYWKEQAEQRKEILAAAAEWTPPHALGVPPDEITDPISRTIMGVTTETIEEWLGLTGDEQRDTIKGFASSPGIEEGTARVIRSQEEIDSVQEDEILVCPLTNPDWVPIFNRIKAAVTDQGGVTSHTAIVTREYGLPSVTGTTIATSEIKTGDRVRVNGNEGIVEILERV